MVHLCNSLTSSTPWTFLTSFALLNPLTLLAPLTLLNHLDPQGLRGFLNFYPCLLHSPPRSLPLLYISQICYISHMSQISKSFLRRCYLHLGCFWALPARDAVQSSLPDSEIRIAILPQNIISRKLSVSPRIWWFSKNRRESFTYLCESKKLICTCMKM